MSLEIRKIETTERIRQIYFLQLVNRLKNNENFCELKLDIDAIEAEFPGLFESHDFTGISVNNLFKFITYETRMGSDCIYYTDFDCAHFPEYLYAFCDTSISEEDLDFNRFPMLYDRFEESAQSDLVAMFLFHSLYLYNKNGDFLNFVKHPNLYDNGILAVYFLDRYFFAVEDEDENNGVTIQLFSFINGQISEAVASSIELLELMDTKCCDWGLDNLSDEFKDNKDALLMALCSQNSSNLKRKDIYPISARLKDDDDIALAAVLVWELNYRYISNRLKLKKDLALLFIKSNHYAFRELPHSLRCDRDFITEVVAAKPEVIDYLQEPFQTDPEIVSIAIQSYPGAYAYYLPLAPPEFLSSKAKVMEMVAKYPKALFQLSNDFMADADVLSTATKKDASVAELIPLLHSNRELALKVVKTNGAVIRYLEIFKNDLQFALECVNYNGLYLQYFPDSIRNSKQVVLQAYQQNKDSVFFATDDLMRDDKIGELLKQSAIEKSADDDLPF